MNKNRVLNKTRVLALCEGAVCIALAYALTFFELDLWFQGGSISVAMLPLVVYAWRHGAGWGVMAGVIFGTIKCFFAGGFAWGWQSILLDYSVAYAAVGLGGLCRRLPHGLVWGALAGGGARFVIHYLSGVTIYAIIAPTELFGLTFLNPWTYSLCYNLGYVLPSTLLVAAAALLLERPLSRLKTPGQ